MKEVKIGILGLGTVGSAVAELIRKNSALIAERAGVRLVIKKGCDIRKLRHPFPVTRDPYEIINDPEISVVVEAIGGARPALNYILAAIERGKHVVTPNKEVLALEAGKIFGAAARRGVFVKCEGAVGGGIPILGPLSHDLLANQVSEIYGIVNGTTNYILSKMTEEGMEFSEALKEAKAKGYAEANPKKDLEGYDASYKAAILAAVAFRQQIPWDKVHFEGIGKITQEDIQYAYEIGYVIKLLAVAKDLNGQVEVRVHPTLVPHDHPLSSVSGPMNAIYVKGDAVGELMFYGQGAGGLATASAVVSDIISLGTSNKVSHYTHWKTAKVRPIEEIESRYYVRLTAPDRHGVLAGISKAFADEKVSIAAVVQKENKGRQATIVIIIHRAREANLKRALKRLKRVDNVIRVGL